MKKLLLLSACYLSAFNYNAYAMDFGKDEIQTSIPSTFDRNSQELEFYTQDEGEFMRVGFSHVKGAPNPLMAPTKYSDENCAITHIPFKIENWIKKEVTEGSLEGVVARYGYGWIFFDIPHQKGLANSMLKYAFATLIRSNDESFRSVCEPICHALYTEARNKVKDIFLCRNSIHDKNSVRVDGAEDRDVMVNFVGSLFYAYGGTLECKPESFLSLPLWEGALDRPVRNGTFRDENLTKEPSRLQCLFWGSKDKVRIFSGTLNDGLYHISAQRTPEENFHIKGLATAYDSKGI